MQQPTDVYDVGPIGHTLQGLGQHIGNLVEVGSDRTN
jgi:hypothetical protein